MSAILLRVLLSISLVLNGSGFAMASPHALMGHVDGMAAMPVDPPEATAVADSPCHAQQHPVVPALEPSDEAPDNSSTTAKSPASDCCTSDICQCACMQHAQASIPVHPLLRAQIERIGSARVLKPGHPAPALPHLIRPPIG